MPLLSCVLQVLVLRRFNAPVFHDKQDEYTKDFQTQIGKNPDHCAFETPLTFARGRRVFHA
jgi:hypothetical protein